MNGLLAIFVLRHMVFTVCTVIAVVLWVVGGFHRVPWVTGLVGSVVVGCPVMTAKSSRHPRNVMVAFILMLAIDALLILGLVKLGFTNAFMAWGIAHVAGVVTASLMMLGAQGAALTAATEEEAAAWVASRGFVIGLGAAIATAMCGGS